MSVAGFCSTNAWIFFLASSSQSTGTTLGWTSHWAQWQWACVERNWRRTRSTVSSITTASSSGPVRSVGCLYMHLLYPFNPNFELKASLCNLQLGCFDFLPSAKKKTSFPLPQDSDHFCNNNKRLRDISFRFCNCFVFSWGNKWSISKLTGFQMQQLSGAMQTAWGQGSANRVQLSFIGC